MTCRLKGIFYQFFREWGDEPGECSYRTFFLERRNRDIMKRQSREVLFSGIITAICISLHNFPEGMAVFLGSVKGLQVGFNLALAIALHNILKPCLQWKLL
ncbi:uncharacterized protein [Arachis hypogaea]|uniref:uncharacterized protein isoform X2 n=1 Tax=Arachis hypogaea TaxID=3818 RepID=UPI0034E7641F